MINFIFYISLIIQMLESRRKSWKKSARRIIGWNKEGGSAKFFFRGFENNMKSALLEASIVHNHRFRRFLVNQLSAVIPD